jgi:hypothetical protein
MADLEYDAEGITPGVSADTFTCDSCGRQDRPRSAMRRFSIPQDDGDLVAWLCGECEAKVLALKPNLFQPHIFARRA